MVSDTEKNKEKELDSIENKLGSCDSQYLELTINKEQIVNDEDLLIDCNNDYEDR